MLKRLAEWYLERCYVSRLKFDGNEKLVYREFLECGDPVTVWGKEEASCGGVYMLEYGCIGSVFVPFFKESIPEIVLFFQKLEVVLEKREKEEKQMNTVRALWARGGGK